MIVNVLYEAGLGDILMSMYSLTNYSALLAGYHDQHPDVQYRAVICTVTDSVESLFRGNPVFKAGYSYHTWLDDRTALIKEQSLGHPYIQDLYNADPHRELWPRHRLPFYLDEDEATIVARFLPLSTVAIHFFAGDGERTWINQIGGDGASTVIRAALDAGYEVLLLGGSSNRTVNNDSRHIVEHLVELTRDPRVHNYIGRHTPRLHSALAISASMVIGPISCYTSLGAVLNRPVFVMAPKWQAPKYAAPDQGIFSLIGTKVIEGTAGVHYFSDDPLPIDSLREFLDRLKLQSRDDSESPVTRIIKRRL